MKKPLFIVMLISVLLIMSACGSNFSFRAKVLAFDPDFALRNEESLLFVNSITSVGSHPVGGRYFISRNDSVTVYDASGKPISYRDILPGTIVDIRFDGVIAQSDPAIIFGAILIRVVEYSRFVLK